MSQARGCGVIVKNPALKSGVIVSLEVQQKKIKEAKRKNEEFSKKEELCERQNEVSEHVSAQKVNKEPDDFLENLQRNDFLLSHICYRPYEQV